MKTILIIIAATYGGVHTSTTEFTNYAACQVAAKRILAERGKIVTFAAFCVKDAQPLLDYHTGEPVQ